MERGPATEMLSSGAVEIQDLYVNFHRRGRDLPVIQGVSLHIGVGESYGLVGESGCGKTTVALAIVRYLARNARVKASSFLVDGQDVLALAEKSLPEFRRRSVAMVYQDPASALNPSMTIGNQMADVFRFTRDVSAAEARNLVVEALQRVAMPDPQGTLRRYPFELSGGQQQRVVIAKALAHNPRLLVLDEPTTGLDATVEAEVLDLIEELRSSINAAILLITHNLGIVARVCERVGVLYAGRIVEEGPARALFTDPRHPYTLGLVRCAPRFGMRKGDASLQPIVGTLPPLGERMPGCIYAKRCLLAQPVCTRREPDLLLPWPSEEAVEARHRAETEPEAPTLQSPHDATPVGAGERHTRCYFPERVPDLPVIVKPFSAEAASVATDGVLLHVESVYRSFRSKPKDLVAVDDVSLELRRGETLGVVGESGSGKTTLANCITGLVAASRGKLVFEDRPLPATAARRRRTVLRAIQMVFQNPDSTLNPSRNTRSILQRAVRKLDGLHGAAARDRVNSLATSVSLEPRCLQQKPTELSGGQKQRVAIARAFAGNPSLVICDEPVSALDVSVEASILNLLADLQATRGVAYIFISHDLAVVRYLADRIAVMYLAWLMELGSAEDVFTPPHHPYTEALTSAIPRLDFDHPVHRIPLHGTLPSLSDPPSGCRFQTRCPRKIGAICENEQPPWRDAGNGHRIRCHIPVDELRRLQEEHLSAESREGT